MRAAVLFSYFSKNSVCLIVAWVLYFDGNVISPLHVYLLKVSELESPV